MDFLIFLLSTGGVLGGCYQLGRSTAFTAFDRHDEAGVAFRRMMYCLVAFVVALLLAAAGSSH